MLSRRQMLQELAALCASTFFSCRNQALNIAASSTAAPTAISDPQQLSPNGALNLVVVNKDATENLQFTATLPQRASSAKVITMTQLSPGATGPSLAATSGVTIQGASINQDGSFAPSAPFDLSTSGSRVAFYVPALSTVLVQITA